MERVDGVGEVSLVIDACTTGFTLYPCVFGLIDVVRYLICELERLRLYWKTCNYKVQVSARWIGHGHVLIFESLLCTTCI